MTTYQATTVPPRPEAAHETASRPATAGAHSARRRARALRSCLFALLAFACMTLAGARRAHALTTVRAYSTAYGEKQDGACSSKLVLAAVSGALEGSPARAQAFSFIFVPREAGKNRVFSVYSFGGGAQFRDDDEGLFALKPYNAQQGIKENLSAFFEKVGCKLNEPGAEALAAALNQNAADTSVDKFASAAGPQWREAFEDLVLLHAERRDDSAWPDRESFGRFVSEFGNTVALHEGGQLIAITKQLSEQKALAEKSASEAAELRRQMDGRLGVNGWAVALLVAAGVLALAYAGRRRLPTISRTSFFGKTGPTDANALTPEAAAAARLKKILLDSLKAFQRTNDPSVIRTILLELQRAVREFQEENQSVTPPGLTDILNRSEQESSYRAAPAQKLKTAYENFWIALRDYVDKPPTTNTPPVEHDADEGPAVPAEPPLTAREFGERMGSLEQNVVGRLDSLEDNVVERLSGNRAQVRELCELWSRPGDPPPDGALDKVLERSREARSVLDKLRLGFGCSDLTLEESKGRILSVAAGLGELKKTYLSDRKPEPTNLADVLNAVKTKLGEGATQREELQKYEREILKTRDALGILAGSDEDLFQAVRRIADDQKKTLHILLDHRPENSTRLAEPVESLLGRLGAAEGQLDDIGKTVRPSSPDPARTPAEMVKSMVEEFDAFRREATRAAQLERELSSVKSDAQQGEQLARTILKRLNFKAAKLDGDPTPVATTIGKLTDASPAHWRLRLGLSAAHDALAESLGAGARGDLVEALSLGDLEERLSALLEDMQELNGDEVWRKGIESGFATGWMHHLLRANLLLRAYFSEAQELNLLRGAVEEASVALKTAMHEYRARVAPVAIFGPRPEGMERAGPAESLLNLPEVRSRVKEVYFAKGKTAEFVVDAKTFSLVSSGKVLSIGRVVLMSPTDWGI
jgi:hypothetical protein